MDDQLLDQTPERRVEKYYRYQDQSVSVGSEEFGFHSAVRVELYEYEVLKHTEHGVWILYYGNPNARKFVLSTARKKFAHPTIEAAKESFVARKTKQIKIYTSRINQIKDALLALGVILENNQNLPGRHGALGL